MELALQSSVPVIHLDVDQGSDKVRVRALVGGDLGGPVRTSPRDLDLYSRVLRARSSWRRSSLLPKQELNIGSSLARLFDELVRFPVRLDSAHRILQRFQIFVVVLRELRILPIVRTHRLAGKRSRVIHRGMSCATLAADTPPPPLSSVTCRLRGRGRFPIG